MGNLFEELKRRNVFRVGVAYLVVGWLMIEVVDTIAPRMAMPEWVPGLVIILVLIGFPISLLLAWAFEVTPEGVKKTEEVDPETSVTSQTGQKINYMIGGGLVLALGFIAWQNLAPGSGSQPSSVEKAQATSTSIAVLPFLNMSSDPEQEYFSDGISEEILNLLAKIPDLHVTSRSSAFSFKGTNTDIPTIANQLGVANVLEGSVRKQGLKVRITAQLIEAATDKHLWSETYDREITDIFAVQDEISAAIVAALKEELGIELVASAESTGTISPEAYDQYLRGRQGVRTRSFESLAEAKTAFEAALAIEPGFHQARIGLAEAIVDEVWIGSESDRTVLERARELVDLVLAVEPDNAEAHLILSLLASPRNRVEEAEEHIRTAFRLDPNNADIITRYARSLGGEIGRSETLELFERARRLDPLNSSVIYEQAIYLEHRLQEYGEAETAYLKAHELNPSDGNPPFNLATMRGYRLGDLVGTIHAMGLSNESDAYDPDGPAFLSSAYSSLGDGEAALALAGEALAISPDYGVALNAKAEALIFMGEKEQALDLIKGALSNPETFYRFASRILLTSQGVYLLLEKEEYGEAEDLLLLAYPGTDKLVDAPPPQTIAETGRGVPVLAAIYRADGRDDEATRLTARLALHTEESELRNRARLNSFDFLQLAFAGTGRLSDDAVLDYLEAATDNGLLLRWRPYIAHNPVFMALHDHPRFIALIERLKAEVARQRAQLEAVE